MTNTEILNLANTRIKPTGGLFRRLKHDQRKSSPHEHQPPG
jgi:hypothetical protein